MTWSGVYSLPILIACQLLETIARLTLNANPRRFDNHDSALTGLPTSQPTLNFSLQTRLFVYNAASLMPQGSGQFL